MREQFARITKKQWLFFVAAVAPCLLLACWLGYLDDITPARDSMPPNYYREIDETVAERTMPLLEVIPSRAVESYAYKKSEAGAVFIYADGTRELARDAASFAYLAHAAKPQSIRKIHFQGNVHGTRFQQGISCYLPN